MRTITDRAHPDHITESMIVFLPGAYDTPEDFQREGFTRSIRERKLAIDVVLADMNLECISDGTALSQLREEIIFPAREEGYRHIWLVGISIGGFMAVHYADQFDREIDGLCLIAPYPGSRIITETIITSGGILKWSPEGNQLDDHETRFWYWLKEHASHGFDVYLGYGSDDRFARAHTEISKLVPHQRTLIMPGGHDWKTWKRIWEGLLETGIFT